MYRIVRISTLAVLVALPAAALARPPLIYHRVANLVAHPGGTVRLALTSHDVIVRVKPGDSVTVSTDLWAEAGSEDAKQTIIKRLAPTVSAKDDDILVQAPRHHWHWGWSWGRSPQALVTVVLPPGMKIDYRLGSGDFRFDNPGAENPIRGVSGSGDVEVKSASKSLSVRAGSGDLLVRLDGPAGGVSLETGSGDISFRGGADSLEARAGSGDIVMRDVAARSAHLGTGSGDIVVHWRKAAANGAVSASAGSGDVTMYFPADTVLGGTVSTGSGDVYTDFPATIHGSRHSYTLAGGAGAVMVDMSTGSGDVSLHKGG